MAEDCYLLSVVNLVLISSLNDHLCTLLLLYATSSVKI